MILRVQFPIPKLYVLQTGLEVREERLSEKVQYDMRLSDSYVSAEEKFGKDALKPDLEAVVHVFDFRMTLSEVLAYIESDQLPERFAGYDNDMRSYALVANGITYIQRMGSDIKYVPPENIADVAEYLKLLLDRGIFVDLLADREVCDMAVLQFSREEELRYRGWEEGREEGWEEGREEGWEEGRKEERKNTEAAVAAGIRNMAELCFRFRQSRQDAKDAVIEKYIDTDVALIDLIISEIYDNKATDTNP